MAISVNPGITDTDGHRHQRKTSTGSSPSRTSSDDDSRHSNSQMNSVTYIGGVTTRQTMPTNPRPSSTNLTNGSSFRMKSTGGNICPRCTKTVYSAEEVKAAGKVTKLVFSLSFKRSIFDFSHFINDVIHVLIVRKVSMLLDIPNTKENSTIIVRFFC